MEALVASHTWERVRRWIDWAPPPGEWWWLPVCSVRASWNIHLDLARRAAFGSRFVCHAHTFHFTAFCCRSALLLQTFVKLQVIPRESHGISRLSFTEIRPTSWILLENLDFYHISTYSISWVMRIPDGVIFWFSLTSHCNVWLHCNYHIVQWPLTDTRLSTFSLSVRRFVLPFQVNFAVVKNACNVDHWYFLINTNTVFLGSVDKVGSK